MRTMNEMKEKAVKLWMLLIFTTIPMLTFAQDPGNPCDDMDPLDNTCPLDSRVYMLVLFLIVGILAAVTLQKKTAKIN